MRRKKSLSDALFSKARQRVLAILFGHSNKTFYTNELIRLTRAGHGAVQRELNHLASVGLINSTSHGKQKHYQANTSSPLFSELESIVLKTFGLTDPILSALTPVQNEIDIAFIYGSIAKQSDTAKSDIDLMLISDTLSYAEIFPLLEKTQKKLARDINPTFYSKAEWIKKRKQKNNFILQLIARPKLFLIGTKHDLDKL